MKEQIKLMNTAVEAILDDEMFIKNIAKVIRKMYNELIKQGFSEAEAISIASNYTVTGK